MTFLRFVSMTVPLLFAAWLLPGQTSKSGPDVWQPFKLLVGKWEGTGTGKPGVSTVQREYRLALNDKFIHVHNVSS